LAEGTGEKTEEATPKRLKEARKKGNVAKSKDLTAAFLFIGGFSVLLASGSYISKGLRELMILAFTVWGEGVSTALIGPVLWEGLITMIKVLFPMVTAAFVIALVISYFQVGSLFTVEPLKPQLKKLNPIEGFKNMFKLKNLVELIKSSIKLFLAVLLAYLVVKGSLRDIYLSIEAPLVDSVQIVAVLLKRIVFRVGLVFITIAVIDMYYQKWQYKKDMRMTKDEVKREYKAEEGDPQIKGARKQIHYEMVMQGRVQEVKNADAIVTNPEQLALAIRYDESTMNAPTVIAKGQRLWAQKIIEMAKKHNIPIMRNIPLAHALNKLEVGDEVPEELYEAVAEILVFVQQLQDQADTGWT